MCAVWRNIGAEGRVRRGEGVRLRCIWGELFLRFFWLVDQKKERFQLAADL